MPNLKESFKSRKKQYDDAIDGEPETTQPSYEDSFDTELSIKELKEKKTAMEKAWKKSKDPEVLTQIAEIGRQIMKLNGELD